jgi:hypothetical protein
MSNIDELSDLSELSESEDELEQRATITETHTIEDRLSNEEMRISLHPKQYNINWEQFSNNVVTVSATEKQKIDYGRLHIKIHGQTKTYTSRRHFNLIRSYNVSGAVH